MAVECDRWNWRELVASEHGPPATTRHVLLTLSLHMNEYGESAFPSQTLVAKRTGLSERAVREHLATAERLQWIAIHQRRRAGKAWFVNEYTATIPDSLASMMKAAPWEEDPTWERPERPAARTPERPADHAQHPERGSATPGTSFQNARHHVPTNSSSNSPENSPEKRAALARDTSVVVLPGVKKARPFPSDEDLERRREEQLALIREAQARKAAEVAK